MAEKNNANIGFEEQLWKAACVLWGHIPAAMEEEKEKNQIKQILNTVAQGVK